MSDSPESIKVVEDINRTIQEAVERSGGKIECYYKEVAKILAILHEYLPGGESNEDINRTIQEAVHKSGGDWKRSYHREVTLILATLHKYLS